MVTEGELEGTAKTDKEDGWSGRGANPEPGRGDAERPVRERELGGDGRYHSDQQTLGAPRCPGHGAEEVLRGRAHRGRSVDNHPGNQNMF